MFEVNNELWKIVFVMPNSSLLKRSDGISSLAVTDDNTKTIYINNRLSGSLLDKVLCHELTHAFCFSYNLAFDIETEEYIADFLASYGRQVFELADEIIRDLIGVVV